MADPRKLVKNSLFNPAVTGSTFEEFSQNAILLPAMEKPPPPVLNITPEEILQSTISSQQNASPAVLNPTETLNTRPSPVSYFQPPPQEFNFIAPQEIQTSQTQSGSNFTSVLSSFSNYLKIGGGDSQLQQQTPQVAPVVPISTGLDNFISQDNSNAPPVPLFNPTAPEVAVPLPVSTDALNSFRRPGLKRPAYAQIPGLISNTNPTPLSVPETTHPNYFTPPLSTISFFQPPVPQPSVSPASSTSSIQDATFALNSQFKPINPLPPSLPPVKPNIPLPQHSHGTLQGHLGPVMDAIPANELPSTPNDGLSGSLSNPGVSVNNEQPNKIYRPVYHHWFHKKESDGKAVWTPFSMVDSLTLEHAFTSNDLDPDKVIATDGGRYDVNILRRQRSPVYWKGTISEVRRCSWFYKNNSDGRYVPYDENVATKLEGELSLIHI